MKNYYVKSGFWDGSTQDKSSLNLTKVVKEVLNQEGYPTSGCCNGKTLLELNFASDVLAAAGGVPIGGVYRNGGDLKIRLV